MDESQPLAGRNAVVTGSGRGIGRAVAAALSAAGARVVLNDRSGAAQEGAAQLAARGAPALAVTGSVADEACAAELVARCVDAFGSIDVLVNCAGVAEPPASSILDIRSEDWRRLIDVHLHGTFHTCRAAAPRMLAQGSGAIVNTSSHAFTGIFGGTGYPAAKGAVNSLGFALAAELRGRGVRVNTVCPGAKTRLSSGPEYEAKIRDLHARGILADAMRDASLAPPEPEHVAPLYVFLASELSAGVTGRLFSASGGYVGLFDPPRETLLGFRDVDAQGAWPLEELTRTLRAAKALSVEP